MGVSMRSYIKKHDNDRDDYADPCARSCMTGRPPRSVIEDQDVRIGGNAIHNVQTPRLK